MPEEYENGGEEKTGADLNLALNLPDEWNEEEMEGNKFEIILRYHGDIEALAEALGVELVTLTGGYAVGRADREQIRELALSPVVIYLTVGEYYRLY
ncbi:MAG: hypothetical protein ACI39R_04430 [Lachnospiraceae bacterium]